jgi:hypothetical protein
MRRYRIMACSALVLCLVAFAAIAALTASRHGDGSRAAAMPTACENFVEATKILAEQGSAAGVGMGGADPFSADAQSRSAETLQNLLEACDAELAMMTR